LMKLRFGKNVFGQFLALNYEQNFYQEPILRSPVTTPRVVYFKNKNWNNWH
jgi:hypothetical protein